MLLSFAVSVSARGTPLAPAAVRCPELSEASGFLAALFDVPRVDASPRVRGRRKRCRWGRGTTPDYPGQRLGIGAAAEVFG
jgi:hypothetical protein